MAKKKTNTTESHHHDLPKKGDEYVCDGCGMRLVIVEDCSCDEGHKDDHVCLRCCGVEMAKNPAG